jgi:hypothetical protein
MAYFMVGLTYGSAGPAPKADAVCKVACSVAGPVQESNMMLRSSVVRIVRHQLVVEFVHKFARNIQG